MYSYILAYIHILLIYTFRSLFIYISSYMIAYNSPSLGLSARAVLEKMFWRAPVDFQHIRLGARGGG